MITVPQIVWSLIILIVTVIAAYLGVRDDT